MEISTILIAAFLYLVFALGLILVVDNLVGLVFRDPRTPFQLYSMAISKAFAASQKLYRK